MIFAGIRMMDSCSLGILQFICFGRIRMDYRKVGNAHQIVTSGVGLFGPNMRVGTKAEIVVVNVDFR